MNDECCHFAKAKLMMNLYSEYFNESQTNSEYRFIISSACWTI